MSRLAVVNSIVSAAIAASVVTPSDAQAVTVTLYPYIAADGTLMDSNLLDGVDVADTAEWGFNALAQFAGAIALVAPGLNDSGFERRVFWEYDLRNVAYPAPVTARLNYRIRGAPVWPFPAVEVHVYSYEANLQGELSDYDIGPVTLHGSITVLPSIPAGAGVSVGSLDVSDAVSRALQNGAIAVGFRFQIDPYTTNLQNQAFIDADDSDRETKPTLVIEDVIPFDTDGDDDVDELDYLLFHDCLVGPSTSNTFNCQEFDANFDGHVDHRDFLSLQRFFTGQN